METRRRGTNGDCSLSHAGKQVLFQKALLKCAEVDAQGKRGSGFIDWATLILKVQLGSPGKKPTFGPERETSPKTELKGDSVTYLWNRRKTPSHIWQNYRLKARTYTCNWNTMTSCWPLVWCLKQEELDLATSAMRRSDVPTKTVVSSLVESADTTPRSWLSPLAMDW